jgi:hypothetical protein
MKCDQTTVGQLIEELDDEFEDCVTEEEVVQSGESRGLWVH